MRSIWILALLLSAVAVVGFGFWFLTPNRSRAELERACLASRVDLREIAGLRVQMRDAGPQDGPAIIHLHGHGRESDYVSAFMAERFFDHGAFDPANVEIQAKGARAQRRGQSKKAMLQDTAASVKRGTSAITASVSSDVSAARNAASSRNL